MLLISENQEDAIKEIERETFQCLSNLMKKIDKPAEKIGINNYSRDDKSLIMDFLTYL